MILVKLRLVAAKSVCESVVDNLVDNALRAEPVGGAVVVRVAQRAIIEVIDHGEGVAREDRRMIFEPFSRKSETTPGRRPRTRNCERVCRFTRWRSFRRGNTWRRSDIQGCVASYRLITNATALAIGRRLFGRTAAIDRYRNQTLIRRDEKRVLEHGSSRAHRSIAQLQSAVASHIALIRRHGAEISSSRFLRLLLGSVDGHFCVAFAGRMLQARHLGRGAARGAPEERKPSPPSLRFSR